MYVHIIHARIHKKDLFKPYQCFGYHLLLTACKELVDPSFQGDQVWQDQTTHLDQQEKCCKQITEISFPAEPSHPRKI